jgi:hypothetical protein
VSEAQAEEQRYSAPELLGTPRPILAMLHVLSRCEGYQSTIHGLKVALNLSDRNCRRNVHDGVTYGMFTLTSVGVGRGAHSIVKLTPKAHAFNRILFGE